MENQINLSPSLENYIETLFFLKDDRGDVRVTDLATKMEVSKASVNKAINQLKELKLVNHAHYGSISLTDEGLFFAEEIAKRHKILFEFLEKIGVSSKQAEEEACIIEHLLSLDTIKKIEKYSNNN